MSLPVIRLTKQTDYGIVLLTHMAWEADQLHNATTLAERARLPQPMVAKILKLLARDDLLISFRGVKGGYRLSRPPEEISVADIIRALEGPIALTECIDDGADECSYQSRCQIRGHWLLINRVVQDAFESIKLSELLDSPPRLGVVSRLVPLGTN